MQFLLIVSFLNQLYNEVSYEHNTFVLLRHSLRSQMGCHVRVINTENDRTTLVEPASF